MNQLDSSREIVGMRSRTSTSEGYAAVFATILIWSTPSLFQYYLNRYYDPWAQNFYRYLVACVSIAPVLIYRMRRRGELIDWRAVAICIVPCLPNVIHQVTQVIALFYMGPGVYTIFTRASVIFTALLALAFFPEERHVVRQWQFQLGTGLGLIGAFGVVWFQPGWKSGHIALPRIIRCIYGHILLGALRHPCKTAFPGTRLNPQLRGDQLDHVCAAVSTYNCIWKNWHPASYRTAS